MVKKFSQEYIAQILDLYEETKSINTVAKAFGISYASVDKYLKAEGVALPTKRGGGKPQGSNTVLKDNTEAVLRLYDDGLRLYEISKKLGIAESSASRILTRNKVKIFKGNSRLSVELKAVVAHKASQAHRKRLGLPALDLSRSFEVLHSAALLQELLSDPEIETVYDIADRLNVSYTTVIPALHRAGLWDQVNHQTGASQEEEEVRMLIESWGIPMKKNQQVLFPFEIDLFSEQHGIGIEFNGDYWHSDVHKARSYHQDKSLLAEKKDIFIYHIAEYEWASPDKRAKMTSQLRSIFGVNSRRVYARKCVVKELTVAQARDFLTVNHLQGTGKSSDKLGLFYGEELVSVMTFCKPRFSDKYQWELSRFCSLADVSVVGGASKLFAQFLRTRQPESIVSYSDIAKTRGTIYTTLGFNLSHISDPNYVWTNFKGVTLTRYQTQMKNEVGIMQGRGMARIYDSGSRVFVWTKPAVESTMPA